MGGRIKIAFFDERRLDHETLSLFRFLASRRFIKPRILGANFLLSRHRFLRKVRNYKPSLAVVSNPYADSFSRLLSELVAMGVPVVVGGHGALPERVRQHGCGFLIEDPEDRNVVRQILDQKLEHSSYISRRQNALEYGRYLSGDALKLLWTEIAIDCN
jgi:glycosyltransferase involved in cell wall biosynthesis